MRKAVLQKLYKFFPFDLTGDCREFMPLSSQIKISCVINFYGRLDLLNGILCSLVQQDFSRESFEVVLVEDQGGTPEGKAMADEFSEQLQVVYRPLEENCGKMGYSRNFGLAQARGEFVLFLDDDTVLLQHNFLSHLVETFAEQPEADAIIPHGHASFALIEDRYDFHDPYFMTSRCMAYRRAVLEQLGGFVSEFVGQEDVEFVVRFTLAEKTAHCCSSLNYYHPPMLVPNWRKGKAVGASFSGLIKRYSFPIWLLTIINCSRHIPLLLLPYRRCREMGRFGLGFLAGVFEGLSGKKSQSYG